MTGYSIKDLENLTGIKAHTIRIWEKRYKILSPERSDTNIRVYDDEALKTILNVSLLNKSGIKISQIARLTQNQMNEKITQITRHHVASNNLLESLLLAMLDLNERQFEKILSNLIAEHGFESVYSNFIMPLFAKIGILWQTNSISPAHEHFVSAIIRNKTILAIERVSISENPTSKKFLLFLPENELHEMGLLYANFLIRKYGHRTVYLGQGVPFQDLSEIVQKSKSDFLFTIITNPISKFELKNYIENLSQSYPDKTIYITGFQIKHHSCSYHAENIVYLENYDSFTQILKNMI